MPAVSRGVTCLACGGRFPAFARYGDPPRPGLCPRCGSKPRHRTLVVLLRRFVRARLTAGSEVLDIGPSRPATRIVPGRRTIGQARYTAVDLDRRPHHTRLRPPHRFRCMDASRLRFGAATFDVIVCNNVLPFVSDDGAVLSEIRRCLKPDGVAMVDVDVQIARTMTVAALRRALPIGTRPHTSRPTAPSGSMAATTLRGCAGPGSCPFVSTRSRGWDAPSGARTA